MSSRMCNDAGAISLSIIVPVYNVEEYIRECLDSVVGQLRSGDQLILVDDGSADRSGTICDEYARRYAQIEVFHQPNCGVAGARNTGLKAAHCEYIAWIDPDDWVEPDWRESIAQALESTHTDILVFDHTLCREDGLEPKHYGRAPGKLDVETLLADIVEDKRIQSALWNKVMKRSLYADIVFDENLRLLEDYDVLHHMIMRAGCAEYLPVSLYDYRIRKEGLTHLRGLDVSFQSFCVARKRKREIEKTGRRCSALGMILQARWFLHFYYMSGSPLSFMKQSMICRWAVLSNSRDIIIQKDITRHEKLRRLFWALPLVGGLYRKRKPLMTV